MNKHSKSKKERIDIQFQKFLEDDKGGSTIESGLLIALALFLFIMIFTMSLGIIEWIQNEINRGLSQNYLIPNP